MIGIAVAMVIAGSALAAIEVSEHGIGRASSGRTRLVSVTGHVIANHPVAGVGIGSQPLAAKEELDTRRRASKNASHTTPLTVLAEFGAIGFLLYLAFLAGAVRLLWEAFRRDRVFGLGLGACFLVLFLHSLFYSGFFEDPVMWGVLGVAAMLVDDNVEVGGACVRTLLVAAAVLAVAGGDATARTDGDPAVPILMYHVIAKRPTGAPYPSLFVPQREFAAQVSWLQSRGYEAVTLDRVFVAWSGGPALPKKPIVLTFDDGSASLPRNALPVLRKLRWPGVLNLKLGNVREHGGISAEQVTRLIRAGWEIDSHTISHPRPDDAVRGGAPT